MSYGFGSIVTATFNPKRLDTLKPDAREHVGRNYRWRFLWDITEDDGGPYVGQEAWEPDRLYHSAWFGWVPTEDLDDIVVVRGPFPDVEASHSPRDEEGGGAGSRGVELG